MDDVRYGFMDLKIFCWVLADHIISLVVNRTNPASNIHVRTDSLLTHKNVVVKLTNS